MPRHRSAKRHHRLTRHVTSDEFQGKADALRQVTRRRDLSSEAAIFAGEGATPREAETADEVAKHTGRSLVPSHERHYGH